MDTRCLVLGSVLLDLYPDGRQFLGGAEFNFAYHVQRLIGGVDLLARLGDDPSGARIRQELEQRHFPTDLLQTDPHKPSKTVQVTLNENHEPSFRIPSDVASEFLDPPGLPAEQLAAYALVYFGTTLQHGEKSRATVRALLAGTAGTKFCDLNLRPPNYSREIVDYSLRTCDDLKLNEPELQVLRPWYGLPAAPEKALEALAARFELQWVCLTRGAAGSQLWELGKIHDQAAPAVAVLDTVGAGDAFSAGLAIGRLKKWAPDRALALASDLAGAVCGIPGAIPGDDGFYRTFLEKVKDQNEGGAGPQPRSEI